MISFQKSKVLGFLLVSLVLIGFVQNSFNYFVNAKFGWGSCDKSIKVKQGFDISQFNGEWLEIAKYRNYLEKGNCQKVNFSNSTGNSSQILVQLSEFRRGSLVSLNVTANVSQEDAAKWILTINMTRNSNQSHHGHRHHRGRRHYHGHGGHGNYSRILEIPLWVIDTDYTNYAILYSCKESRLGLFHMEYAWIVSRKVDSITDDQMKQLLQGLESSKIYGRYMVFSRQTFCAIHGGRGGRSGWHGRGRRERD